MGEEILLAKYDKSWHPHDWGKAQIKIGLMMTIITNHKLLGLQPDHGMNFQTLPPTTKYLKEIMSAMKKQVSFFLIFSFSCIWW